MAEERVIVAKKIPQNGRRRKGFSSAQLLTKLCYFYPQYTYDMARGLPYFRVMQLLKTAEREKAADYLNMLQIAVAPHSERGDMYKKLLKQYEKLANG